MRIRAEMRVMVEIRIPINIGGYGWGLGFD